MATIREYFDTDARVMTIHRDWNYSTRAGELLAAIRAKVAIDFHANAKYWYFFVPPVADVLECISVLLSAPEVERCVLSPAGDSVSVQVGFSDYSERQNNSTLVFTRRAFFYVDALLSVEERQAISSLCAAHGLFSVVYDREYAVKRSDSERPLAFISHDSRDKDALVRELAHEMSVLMCPVWYDEYSLSVGDSLRTSIEKGLKEARKCVLILSPNFLSNEGWGKAEFESVFTREILERENVILPVWHNVGLTDVYNYSPRLADRVGLPSSLGVKELARQLSNVAKGGG